MSQTPVLQEREGALNIVQKIPILFNSIHLLQIDNICETLLQSKMPRLLKQNRSKPHLPTILLSPCTLSLMFPESFASVCTKKQIKK